jgi:hypothetical protein
MDTEIFFQAVIALFLRSFREALFAELFQVQASLSSLYAFITTAISCADI